MKKLKLKTYSYNFLLERCKRVIESFNSKSDKELLSKYILLASQRIENSNDIKKRTFLEDCNELIEKEYERRTV